MHPSSTRVASAVLAYGMAVATVAAPTVGPAAGERSYKLGLNAYVVKLVDFHEFANAIKKLGVLWVVMALVVAGLPNKQVASKPGTSQTTMKIQRHQVMEKLGAGSLAELVRMADRLTPKS